ncbi:MAG: TetR/AcrR family transcriptional regulator [Pseudonocardiales bacterium]|nr:TetR/AcrR family transcriptional regulator [Pseudonocardiales bacterium]PZS32498.1 MAG: TetR/AcrR family transcriptional regulator [Pseudonocardiales bacterium]
MSRPSTRDLPSAARARRRLSSEARRGELLDAALREFGSRGYYLTQMEHVAATAGVSKALVYQHFPSKEELFAAVTVQVVEGFMSRLPEVLGNAGDALGAWRGAVRLLCDLVTERPEAWALVARHLDNPELGASLRGLRDQVTEVFAAVLAGYYAPEQGSAVPAEEVLEQARLTVPLVVGALQGLMSWWLDHPEVPRAKVEARAVDFGWLGLDRIRRGEWLPLAGD